jgi:TonB family protein
MIPKSAPDSGRGAGFQGSKCFPAMKNVKTLLMLAGLMAVAWQRAPRQVFKVIANRAVPADEISPAELRSIFLEQTLRFAGTSVEPVIEMSGPTSDAFLKEYVGRDVDGLQMYYRTLVFNGRGSMPKTLGSDAEVVAYVTKTKGAIGYVSASSNTDNVKTLAITSGKNRGERVLLTHVDPEYPEILRKMRIGGLVRLRVTISAKGNVERADLLGGNPILGENAITAVKRWVYAAGSSQTTVEVSIPFDPEH